MTAGFFAPQQRPARAAHVTLAGMVAWAAAGAASGFLAWAVRGRSSAVFGPSVYRGDPARRTVALTFDDGPSEDTPRLLEILADDRVPATFFQCGANVERLPGIARAVAAAGHEIGNHSQTHPPMYLRASSFIFREFARAQETIVGVVGVRPRLLRAPYGARWFGFGEAQRRLGLLGVMWTVLGRDWKLAAPAVAARVIRRVSSGAIICLHDGRALEARPDLEPTIRAVREIIPALQDRGYRFATVSQLLCPQN
jgi:peptidoglycan/xylan/chitin deacetylase (PgdA/CDA1 family)